MSAIDIALSPSEEPSDHKIWAEARAELGALRKKAEAFDRQTDGMLLRLRELQHENANLLRGAQKLAALSRDLWADLPSTFGDRHVRLDRYKEAVEFANSLPREQAIRPMSQCSTDDPHSELWDLSGPGSEPR